MTSALNNLTICYDHAEIKSSILALIGKEVPDTDPVLDYIISPNSMNYGASLSKEIDNLLDDNHSV